MIMDSVEELPGCPGGPGSQAHVSKVDPTTPVGESL